ncbi:MAG: hypothetical protein U9Q81_21900, partial [Pseudomonadota bacterium]|nr:hypothetical protein [Pseudomonadota bacterium]
MSQLRPLIRSSIAATSWRVSTTGTRSGRIARTTSSTQPVSAVNIDLLRPVAMVERAKALTHLFDQLRG